MRLASSDLDRTREAIAAAAADFIDIAEIVAIHRKNGNTAAMNSARAAQQKRLLAVRAAVDDYLQALSAS